MEHASTIAVAMDVNEIASVELIVGAIENGAPADAAVPAAIGILMRERASALESLLTLLRCGGGTVPLDSVMDDELKEYVENLLKDGTLFGRLVKLVTAPPPGGPLLVAPAAAARGGCVGSRERTATFDRASARSPRQARRHTRTADITSRMRRSGA